MQIELILSGIETHASVYTGVRVEERAKNKPMNCASISQAVTDTLIRRGE